MNAVGETISQTPPGAGTNRSDFWVGLTVLTAICFGGVMMVRLFL